MANLSNINNVLRISSSGVGLNKDNTGPSELDIESAGADMIDMTRTGLKTYRLAISGASDFSIFDVAANDDRLVISSGGAATFAGKIIGQDGDSVQLELKRTSSGTDGNTSIKFLQPLGDGYLGVNSTGALSFGTHPNLIVDNKFKVDRSGNATFGGSVTAVGVSSTIASATSGYFATGTAIPANQILHVRDNVGQVATNSAGGIKISSSPGNDVFLLKRNDGGTSYFALQNSSAAEFITTNMADGKVGIGTNSPDAKLHIYGSASLSEMYLGEDAAADKAGILKYTQGDGSGTGVVTLSHWGNNSLTEGLAIKYGGNVGIGTTSPECKLSIDYTAAELPTSGTTSNSAIQLTSSLNNQLNLGLNTVSGNYGAYIQASDNNLAVPYPLNLQPNGGNVGIGTTSPQSKLDLVQPDSSANTLGQSVTASLGIRMANAIGQVGQIVFNNDAAPSYGYGSIGMIMTSGSGVGLGDMIFATKSTGADNPSAERMRITSGGAISLANSNTSVIGRPFNTGTIANGQSVTVNLNPAGGNQSTGFIAISAVPNGVSASGAVGLFTHIHTQGANVYTELSKREEGSITISESGGAFTISNSSGSTVYYNIKVLNLTDFASTIAGT